jgi:hypothetical protein
MAQVKTVQELYDHFILELQSLRPDLTDTNEGSVIDTYAGVTSTAVHEALRRVVTEFRKTYIETANGPEVTGGPDDLQTLAVDHFGADFARPAAAKATGNATFSRVNALAGNCIIPSGTIVKTVTSQTGSSVRFETTAEVTMVGTSIVAPIRAVVAGVEGNVNASKITVIESSLTDSSITVNNPSAATGGAAAQNDSEYRETIRLLITRVRGATKAAVEAAALAVDGVEYAVAVESERVVIDYDIEDDWIAFGAEYFRIPFVTLYIADSLGTASLTLINDVYAAIESVRALGVYIKVVGASAIAINWTASITLNGSGPNYAELSSDPQKIIDTMRDYIAALPIGSDFIRADANAAILDIWGSGGTDDITAFTTSIPVGDVVAAANEKLINGTVSIV